MTSIFDETKHKLNESNHDNILSSENNLFRKAKADIENRKYIVI